MEPELDIQRGMTPEQRSAFQMRMNGVRKNSGTAIILSVFGLGRFYLEDVGLGILQWLLAFIFIGFFWMFIDIFTASSRAETYNQRKAAEIAKAVRSCFPGTSPASAPTTWCNACGSSVENDTKFCGSCGAIHSSAAQLSPEMQNRKKCPACAELIQLDAKKCRFCGELLPVEAVQQA